MSPTLEIICCSATMLFWLAPLVFVTLCVTAGGCVQLATLARRLLGAPKAPLRA